MNWLNDPEHLMISPRGCGTNICWSRDGNQDCEADYCVIRICLTNY